MDTAPALPLLLAELTSDVMSELPLTARLTWILLSSKPTPVPVRLNMTRLRLHLSATFDLDASRDDVELAVLMLDEAGLIATSAGQDGRERYQIRCRPARVPDSPEPASTAPETAAQTAPVDAFIGTVERAREKASESSASEPPRSRPRTTLAPPPPPFCHDHMPLGSGGVPCVACKDMTLANRHWELNRMHGAEWETQPRPEPPRPHHTPKQPTLFDDTDTHEDSSRSPEFRRRPRFDVEDPDDPWPLSVEDLPW